MDLFWLLMLVLVLCPSGVEWGKGGVKLSMPWWVPVAEHVLGRLRDAGGWRKVEEPVTRVTANGFHSSAKAAPVATADDEEAIPERSPAR